MFSRESGEPEIPTGALPKKGDLKMLWKVLKKKDNFRFSVQNRKWVVFFYFWQYFQALGRAAEESQESHYDPQVNFKKTLQQHDCGDSAAPHPIHAKTEFSKFKQVQVGFWDPLL